MAFSHEPNPRHLSPVGSLPAEDIRRLSDVELDRRIKGGWDVWCDLLDDLLNTGGMLPSREVAGRVTAFFGDAYWRAEEARTEALRRQLVTLHRSRIRDADRSLGLT